MATPAHWVITSFGWRAAIGAYAVVILGLMPCVWRRPVSLPTPTAR